MSHVRSLSARRAWIEIVFLTLTVPNVPSLSARRAWIEITHQWNPSKLAKVALRKESVDRNIVSAFDVLAVSASLSARRAWIEIEEQTEQESTVEGRSPQGERG